MGLTYHSALIGQSEWFKSQGFTTSGCLLACKQHAQLRNINIEYITVQEQTTAVWKVDFNSNKLHICTLDYATTYTLLLLFEIYRVGKIHHMLKI